MFDAVFAECCAKSKVSVSSWARPDPYLSVVNDILLLQTHGRTRQLAPTEKKKTKKFNGRFNITIFFGKT